MMSCCLRHVHTCKFKFLLLVVPLGKGLEELVLNMEWFPPVVQKVIERLKSLTSCRFGRMDFVLGSQVKGATFFLVTAQTPPLAARNWPKTNSRISMCRVSIDL